MPSMCQVRAEEWLWDVITCWHEPSEYRHVKEVWNIVKAVNIRVLAGWLVLLDKNGPVTSAAVRQNCQLCLSYLKWLKSKYITDSQKDNYMLTYCYFDWWLISLSIKYMHTYISFIIFVIIYCHYYAWNKTTEYDVRGN